MANIHGAAGVWALTGFSISLTGSYKFQDADHSVKAEMDVIKDANGETVTKAYYDTTEEITFTGVPTGTSGSVVLNGLSPGTLFTITDPNSPAAGANWIVEDFSTKRTNTNFARVTLKCWRSANITS